MIDYWQYKAVHYWLNTVKNRRAYCLDAEFFRPAVTVIAREEAVRRIWALLPKELLHVLQTRDEPYLDRLDFSASLESIIQVLWNHAPCRETVRGLLLQAAHEWLATAERGGIAEVPSERIAPSDEVEICVRKNLLVPPGICESPDALRGYVTSAVR